MDMVVLDNKAFRYLKLVIFINACSQLLHYFLLRRQNCTRLVHTAFWISSLVFVHDLIIAIYMMLLKNSLLSGKQVLPLAKDMENSKSTMENRVMTLQERKQHADKEEQAVEKEVQELLAWTDMIEGMDDSQLKTYVKNRPKHLKTAKWEKVGKSRRFKGVEKCKRSVGSGIMAAVWKFHKEGDGDSL